MTQTQLREKAKNMFDEEFGYKSLDFHDGFDCDGCSKCQNERQAYKEFIDQIITLALEEKIKEVEKKIRSFETDERKVHIFGHGMDSWEARSYDDKQLVNAVIKDILKSLKQ